MNRHLGRYLLLGMVDKTVASSSRTVGFISNNKPILYKNCHSAGQNMFAFFGPHDEAAISKYHSFDLIFEKVGVAVEWRRTAVMTCLPRMPSNYFLLTEMHFGDTHTEMDVRDTDMEGIFSGCGCYTSSDRWYKAVSPAVGTGIGIR